MEKTFSEKVIAVQFGLKAPKSQYNNFGGYAYRNCEDIMEAVKPLLKEQGLFLTINDEVVLIGDRYYIKATATLTDGKDTIYTSALARESAEKKGMDQSQVTGASSSYARKYCLSGLFCLDDNKDADSKDNTAKGNPKKTELTEEELKAKLKEAIAKINAVTTQEDLAKVTREYKPVLGKNIEFIKAVKASPYCPKTTKK